MSKIKLLAIFFLLVFSFLISPQKISAAEPLCCVDGYSNGDFACPFGTDQIKQCCKRYGFAQYDVKDKIVCGSTQPPETKLCCPSGFDTSDNSCPFGTDKNKQCCRRYGFGQYQTVDKLICGTEPPPEANLCCASGFSNGDFVCPFGTDQSKQCCRRFDFGQYEVIDKLQCNTTTGLIGNYCCPKGYSTSALECPAGTDLTKQCCKRLAFGQYEKVDKITCTLGPTSGGGSGVDCSMEPEKCSSAAGKFCNPDTNQAVDKNDPRAKGIYTAIGCIPTEPSALITKLLTFAAGGAGGIALLLMIFGAFRMTTSAGNPESLKAGQEQFTSAVIGLLFIIFAVLLLQIIGVDILGLPGFTK